MPDPVLDAIETIRKRNRLNVDVNRLCDAFGIVYQDAIVAEESAWGTSGPRDEVLAVLTHKGKSDG